MYTSGSRSCTPFYTWLFFHLTVVLKNGSGTSCCREFSCPEAQPFLVPCGWTSKWFPSFSCYTTSCAVRCCPFPHAQVCLWRRRSSRSRRIWGAEGAFLALVELPDCCLNVWSPAPVPPSHVQARLGLQQAGQFRVLSYVQLLAEMIGQKWY